MYKKSHGTENHQGTNTRSSLSTAARKLLTKSKLPYYSHQAILIQQSSWHTPLSHRSTTISSAFSSADAGNYSINPQLFDSNSSGGGKAAHADLIDHSTFSSNPRAMAQEDTSDLLGDVQARPLGDVPTALIDQSDEEAIHAAAPVAAPPVKVTAEVRRRVWALRSVLKVFVTKVDPNYAQPWQMCPQRASSGSAFVIDGTRRMILTNSHVVSNATAVYVRRPGMAKKFKAEILAEAKVCDLALLTVREDSFWDPDMRPLEFVEVPELQSPISVAGYPVGGDSLSITKGIVSRVTLVRYSPAARLLGIQIDAAINPGNSGGPAFADLESGKVAGVTFSKNVSSTTDNIGYIIPYQVVSHFLDEYEKYGMYRGVPCAGFMTQDMENPAQRAYLRVPEHRSGVLVVKLDPLSAAATVLRENDVIMEVAGQPVADDGTAMFRDDERLEYTHLIRSMHVGEDLSLTILRDGQELEVHYELALKDHLVPMLHGVDCEPSYFIVGGLVFMPLTQPFLEMVFGGGGKRSRRADIPVAVLSALNSDKTQRGQQVLAHEINHGYRYAVVPCETFNGKAIHNLSELAAMVDTCQDRYLNFGLEGGRLISLDRQDAEHHGPQILRVHAIPSDRSDDLKRSAAADAAAKPEAAAGEGASGALEKAEGAL